MSHRQEEFQRLYEACHPAFLRYCTGLCYGTMDTRDLIQDSLLAAYENLDKLKSKDKFLHYLIRTARNKAISTWRRSKFRGEWTDSFQQTLISQSVSPEKLVDVQLLYSAMNKLPARQKEAVLLFEVIGFKIHEIANLQNASIPAVKTRLSRARKKLKHQLTDKHLHTQTTIFGGGGLAKKSILDQLFHTANNLPLPYGPVEISQWVSQSIRSGAVAATGIGTAGLALKSAIGGWKLYVLALSATVLYMQADSKQMPSEARVLNGAIDQSTPNQWETTLDLWSLPEKPSVFTTSGSPIDPDTLPLQQPRPTLSNSDSLPSITEPPIDSIPVSPHDLLPSLANTLFGTKAAIISDSLPGLAESISEDPSEQLPGEVGEQTGDKYTMDPDQGHYLLLFFNDPVNIQEAKMAVTNYNRAFHKLDQLQISHVFLGSTPKDHQAMIIVRRFSDMDESIKYFQSFMQHAGDFMPEEQTYQVFTASLDNYRTILRQKSFKGYPAFFESNYLPKGRKR